MKSPIEIHADGVDAGELQSVIAERLARAAAPELPAFEELTPLPPAEDEIGQLLDALEQSRHGDTVPPQTRLRAVKRVVQRLMRVYTATQNAFNDTTHVLLLRAFQTIEQMQEDLVSLRERTGLRANLQDGFDYDGFLARYYGDRDAIAAKHAPYVEHFGGKQNVLDVGCGSGGFLLACHRAGIRATGIDINPDLRAATELGLDVRKADALTFLAGASDGAFDGIFCAQMIEHLYPSEVVELFRAFGRKSAAGAVLVVEVPNVRNLGVLARCFYSDLSHVRPYSIEILSFLGTSAGFGEPTVVTSSPLPDEIKLQPLPWQGEPPAWLAAMNRNLEKLNAMLAGDLDVALIFRKPA